MNNISTRTSALASRHRELGSELEDWNGMGTAWSYNTDPENEHDAVRDAAGMFDMSPLKKVWIRGRDAANVVDHMITRNMRKVYPGKSAYGAVLTEQGTVSDDAIIANVSDDVWLLCHGSGGSMERLSESAQGKSVDIEFDDDLHNIALQGPASLDVLDAHCDADLNTLDYFHHMETSLFGHPCRVSRTGYSGEKGYEIFAGSNVVGSLWDSILQSGEAHGVMPCSFTALDKVRIEAALLFYGYDMTEEHTPWEVGLGFTVAKDKGDYRGKAAVEQSRDKPRFLAGGIVADMDDALVGGESLILNGQDVGVVNSPCWSHRMKQSLALAHINPEAASAGTSLVVKGDGMECTATVAAIPFFDPQKQRTKA